MASRTKLKGMSESISPSLSGCLGAITNSILLSFILSHSVMICLSSPGCVDAANTYFLSIGLSLTLLLIDSHNLIFPKTATFS